MTPLLLAVGLFAVGGAGFFLGGIFLRRVVNRTRGAAPSPRRPVAPSPRGPGPRTYRALLREARTLNERVAHFEARHSDEDRAVAECRAFAERSRAAARDAAREALARVEPPKPREASAAYLRRLDRMVRDLRRRTRGPGEGR